MAVRKSKVAKRRCPWVDLTKPDYVEYHDKEWGVPVHDDRTMFEFLTLEAAQAGLSWYTVLRKREAYRKAFGQFHPERVARYGKRELASLLKNPGIIRNRQKIYAAMNNAQRFLEVQAEFGSFDAYIWRFVGGQADRAQVKTPERLSGVQRRVGCAEQRLEAAWIQVCRLNDLLRSYASHRDDQRSRRRLFS